MLFPGHALPPLPVVFFCLDNVNRKLGTDHGAHTAAGTLIAVFHVDDMVPVTVNLGRPGQGFLRAELDAELAPFAPVLDDIDPVLA